MSSIKTKGSTKQIARSKLKTYLPYALSVAAIAIFIVYLWRNIDRYQQLFNLSIETLLSLIGLALTFALINGTINYFFYKALNVFLTFNEGIGLAAVNTLANQLPFAGGLIAKGVYLKQRYELAYTRFLSATIALYICFVATNGMVALITLGYWALTREVRVPIALVAGFGAMVASIISLWLPLDAISLPGKLGKYLTQLGEGWRVLSRNSTLVIAMIGLQVMTTLLFAGRFWIAFHTLSQNVTYTQCLLFSSATVLTRLVNIAPGGLGVREGIVAGIASTLGFEPGVSAVAVGLDRLVATSVVIVLGTIYTYILSKKATEAKQDNSTISGE